MANRFSNTNFAPTKIATRNPVTGSTNQCFTVSSCGSISTLTFITTKFVDALSSMTGFQQVSTLILIYLTLQTGHVRRTGTMKTTSSVCTVTMAVKIPYIAFIDVLVTVVTCPSYKDETSCSFEVLKIVST